MAEIRKGGGGSDLETHDQTACLNALEGRVAALERTLAAETIVQQLTELTGGHYSAAGEAHRAAYECLEARLRADFALRWDDIHTVHNRKHDEHRASAETRDASIREQIAMLARSHDSACGAHTDTLEQLGVQMRCELATHMDEMFRVHDAKHNEHSSLVQEQTTALANDYCTLGEAHRQALEGLNALFRGELAAHKGELEDQNDKYIANIEAIRGEIAQHDNVHSRCSAEYGSALRDLDAKFMDELDKWHCKLESANKVSLAQVEAKINDEMLKLIVENKRNQVAMKDMLEGHRVDTLVAQTRKQADQSKALDVLHADMRTEMIGKHSKLDVAVKAAIQEMDSKLQDEAAKLISRLDRSNDVTRELLENQTLEIVLKSRHDQKQALEELETRILEKSSSWQERAEGAQKIALATLEDNLKSDFAKIACESQKGIAALREVLGEDKAEARAHVLQRVVSNKTALEGVVGRIDDLSAKMVKVEASQRSDIRAVASELREEMANGNKAKMETGMQEMRLSFKSELEGQKAKLEAQIQILALDLNKKHVTEILQLQEDHASQQATICKDLQEIHLEIEKLTSNLQSSQENSQSSLQQGMRELENRIGAELASTRARGPGLDWDDGLTLPDFQGCEVRCDTAREFLLEFARRLRDMQATMAAEVIARQEHVQRVESQLQEEDVRRQAFQDLVMDKCEQQEAKVDAEVLYLKERESMMNALISEDRQLSVESSVTRHISHVDAVRSSQEPLAQMATPLIVPRSPIFAPRSPQMQCATLKPRTSSMHAPVGMDSRNSEGSFKLGVGPLLVVGPCASSPASIAAPPGSRSNSAVRRR